MSYAGSMLAHVFEFGRRALAFSTAVLGAMSWERQGCPDGSSRILSWVVVGTADAHRASARHRHWAWVVPLLLCIAMLAPPAQAQSCTYTLNPTSASFPASGGTGSVQVSIPSECITTGSFFARSNNNWIEITNGNLLSDGRVQYFGSSATVTYRVLPNSNPNTDTGTITIAGRTFTVTQAGAVSCTYTLNPTSASFPASGGNGSVQVSIPSECITTGSFFARSNNDWIQITNGNLLSDGRVQYFGSSGTVTYRVDPNPDPNADTGTVTIAGRTFTVNQAGSGAPTTQAPILTVVEYRHASFGHYFVTAIANEIAQLDAGVFAGWQRTGQTFKVFGGSPAMLPQGTEVCRFFSTSFAPKSSHFYTPVASECAVVKQNPDWQFEAVVFNVMDASGVLGTPGTCNNAVGPQPLYRLYNDGQSGAPNHRYTTSLLIRADMIANGWIPEGFGSLGVIGCVPTP